MTECTKCGKTLPPPYKQVLAKGEKIYCASCGPNNGNFRVNEDEYPQSYAVTDYMSTKNDWRDYFFKLGVDYGPSEEHGEGSNEECSKVRNDETPENYETAVAPADNSKHLILDFEKYEKAIRHAVLLAYYFGRRFDNTNRHEEVRRVIEPETAQLENDKKPKTLVKLLFYYTILAETYRFRDPSQYRRNLLTVSLKIERLGFELPFQVYKSILEATTTTAKSSYFGSHVVQGCDHNPILVSEVSMKLLGLPAYDTAAKVVGLTIEDYREFESKYGHLLLHEIMARHGFIFD